VVKRITEREKGDVVYKEEVTFLGGFTGRDGAGAGAVEWRSKSGFWVSVVVSSTDLYFLSTVGEEKRHHRRG